MSGAGMSQANEHLPGCPAALSCRALTRTAAARSSRPCSRSPFARSASQSPTGRAHARWQEARAKAAKRHAELIRELRKDEARAHARFRETADDSVAVERGIRTARALLERHRRSTARLWGAAKISPKGVIGPR